MRTVAVVAIVVLAACAVNWLRAGAGAFHIAEVLPFCSGGEPSVYDAASVVLILTALWGLARLLRRGSG